MKILLVNLHSSQNAGDDVLTRVSIELLQRQFPHAEIVLAMNDPHSHQGDERVVGSFMAWVKRNGRFHPLHLPLGLLAALWGLISYRLLGMRGISLLPRQTRPLLKAYAEADMVISAAGNYLYSSGAVGTAFLMNFFIVAFGYWMGKPIYTMPQTIGPLSKPWEPLLVRQLVKMVRLLFVRESVSQRMLQQVGAWDNHCHMVPDVAFLFTGRDEKAGCQLLRSHGVEVEGKRPLLGVTLINWQAMSRSFSMEQQQAYEEAVAKAVTFFVEEKGGTAVLFSQVRGPADSDDDRIPARRVKQRLATLADRVIFIEPKEITAETLKGAYGRMDLFIGTRLHSNIFALVEQVPALLIAYQYKTTGIVKMMTLDQWIVPIEAALDDVLVEKLKLLYAQKEQLTQHIAKQIEQRQSELASMMVMIEKDYQSL